MQNIHSIKNTSIANLLVKGLLNCSFSHLGRNPKQQNNFKDVDNEKLPLSELFIGKKVKADI